MISINNLLTRININDTQIIGGSQRIREAPSWALTRVTSILLDQLGLISVQNMTQVIGNISFPYWKFNVKHISENAIVAAHTLERQPDNHRFPARRDRRGHGRRSPAPLASPPAPRPQHAVPRGPGLPDARRPRRDPGDGARAHQKEKPAA